MKKASVVMVLWYLCLCVCSDVYARAYKVHRTQPTQAEPKKVQSTTPKKKTTQKKTPTSRSRRSQRQRRGGSRTRRAGVASDFSTDAIAFSFMQEHHVDVQKPRERDGSYSWVEQETQPFNELIFSWNACRPQHGYFTFRVSVLHGGTWSPLRKLAEWGHKVQRTFGHEKSRHVHTKHVRVELQGAAMATGFKVVVTAEHGAHFKDLHALFVSTANMEKYHKTLFGSDLPSVMVSQVPAFSQWIGSHPRRKDFCSPTSTSMIVRYFKRHYVDQEPSHRWGHDELVSFADGVHDHSLDIYGNWIMNVAQAYDATEGKVFYRVQRLNNFAELHHYLMRKIPVAVSIRGALRGCAWPYNNGHFVVVVGWNKEKQMVRCIDPAFKNVRQTARWYHLTDFLRAWGKSRNLSYISLPKQQGNR